MLFADSEIPQSITDVLMLPLIILFFGAFVYAAGYFKGLQLRRLPRFRWVGVALIAGAIALGFMSYWKLQDSLYAAAVPGRRVLFAHYIGFYFPVVCALGVGVMEFLYKRKGREWE